MKRLVILIFLMFSLRAYSPESNCLVILGSSPIVISDPLLFAFKYVESNFDADTVNRLGYGGILQIGQEMIDEVNRICKLKGYPQRFILDDRLNPYKSEDIWYIVHEHHNQDYQFKRACKVWNPTASKKYSNKIKQAYIDKIVCDMFTELMK